jgi:hypothetical protein
LTRTAISGRPGIAEACERLTRLELAVVAASWAAEVGGRVTLL